MRRSDHMSYVWRRLNKGPRADARRSTNSNRGIQRKNSSRRRPCWDSRDELLSASFVHPSASTRCALWANFRQMVGHPAQTQRARQLQIRKLQRQSSEFVSQLTNCPVLGPMLVCRTHHIFLLLLLVYYIWRKLACACKRTEFRPCCYHVATLLHILITWGSIALC
jgi:hypothetical protein